jgi:HEAT repeat protein/TolA-binding protein
MNEIAQKRIQDYKEKVAASIERSLGSEITDDSRARLILLLSEIGLSKFEGTVFTFLQNHISYEEAILAGAEFHSEKINDFLFEKVFNHKTPHRDIITEQLGLIKDQSHVDKFVQLLADHDRHVRFQAAHALFNIGGKDAALAMCEYISDPDEWISMNILRLLCIMREHESIPILVEKFHKDDDLRRKAAMVSFLARFKSVTLIKIFDEGLASRDARLKANSIEAIGDLNLPDNEIKNRIEPFLQDPNNRIRANSILALARIEPELVRPEIKNMVESNDIQLRRSAAFILGMIDSRGHEELAEKLVVDRSDVVRRRMVQSLRNFSSDFVCAQLHQALSDENKWIRKHALDMSGKITNFPNEKILALLKTERAAPNLEACMRFFVSHPDEVALKPLKLHVKDERPQVIKALLDAVAAINGVEGVKNISPRLNRRDPKVIRILTEVLVKAGERKILEDLIDKFAQTRKEKEINTLIPSIRSCMDMLNHEDSIPASLLESLEAIEVEETPEPVEEEKPQEEEEEEFELKPPAKSEDISTEELSFEEGSSQEAEAQSPEPDFGELELPSLELSETRKKKKKKKKRSKYYVKGMKAYNLGKFKRAINEFNQLIETEKEIPAKIYMYMGIMHAEKKKYEHARAYFETFLKQKPEHPKAIYLYGKVLKELKKWEELIKVYSKFTGGELDASPKMKKTIYKELGIANVLTGKNERGYQLLMTLNKVQPDNPEVGYYLALAQYYLHKPSAAAALLDNILERPCKSKRIKKLAKALMSKVKAGGVV